MRVSTDKGEVEGTVEDRVVVFKGIPYAAPPVGDLRWQRPQPASPWSGVRKCDTFSKSCIQPVFASMDGTEPVGKQSEDSLYLNVWTTGGGTTARKPVMVWIHGGGFQIGDGVASAYNGTRLALKGAIVVTFNYRLGHLGFFAHPSLERETRGGPVNFGVLDQIEALKWVKNNILEFGGDPGNVTIFGQSAGAASVLTLFASPEARNLFHKGIAQSPYAIPEHSRDKAIALGAYVATRVFGAGENPSVADLRRIPAEKFALAHYKHPIGIPEPQRVPSLGPVAIVGDEVLPMGVRATFQAGSQQRLPLILGNTSNEESVLEAFGVNAELVLTAIESIQPGAVAFLKTLYQGDPELHIPDDLNDPKRFGGLVMRDFLFTMHVRWIAQQHLLKSEVRRYYFGYVPEKLGAEWPHGVPHGGELVFPFDTGGTAYGTVGKFTDADKAMALKVSNYWFTFAQTGTPTGEVAWPRQRMPLLQPPEDRTLQLGRQIAVQSDFRKTRLELYAQMYPEFVQWIEGRPVS